jgi:2-methylisocitrate lyase-like PEP mutase family enzyme
MMKKSEIIEQAKTFLELHHSPALFILPNAWDVVSAKIFELEGFQAIGTTSAGISSTLGYPDGQKMNLNELKSVTSRIIDCIKLPLSVDIEAGYSETVEGVVNSAYEVLKIGAVGINLEDSTRSSTNPLYETSFQCEKISAIREMCENIGIHLVINARTDVFLESNDSTKNKTIHTIERANKYKEAGADCIFVPDVGDFNSEIITELVKEIDAPVNVIAGANTPPTSELQEIGVARVSLGPRPMRATFELLRNISQELLQFGTYTQMTGGTTTYSEVNSWFAKVRS